MHINFAHLKEEDGDTESCEDASGKLGAITVAQVEQNDRDDHDHDKGSGQGGREGPAIANFHIT